jgi:hypothetical protein
MKLDNPVDGARHIFCFQLADATYSLVTRSVTWSMTLTFTGEAFPSADMEKSDASKRPVM